MEEKLLKKYNYSTLKTIGLEGIWGFLIYSILLIIFQLISCDNWNYSTKEGICFIDIDSSSHIENTIFAFNQIKENYKILVSALIFCLGVILYNIAVLSIFKYRSVILALMLSGIIYYIFLFISFSLTSNSQINFSGMEFHWIQIVGFIIQILAFLIYSEILVIPFFGLGEKVHKANSNLKNGAPLIDIGLEN